MDLRRERQRQSFLRNYVYLYICLFNFSFIFWVGVGFETFLTVMFLTGGAQCHCVTIRLEFIKKNNKSNNLHQLLRVKTLTGSGGCFKDPTVQTGTQDSLEGDGNKGGASTWIGPVIRCRCRL